MQKQQISTAVRSYREAGLRAVERRQWPQAADAFEKAAHLARGDGELWLQLARARLNDGDASTAAAAARRCVELMPQSLLGHQFLFESLRQLGRHDDIVELAARYHEVVSASAELLLVQADSLADLGRASAAVPVYLKALGLDAKNTMAHYRLGVVLQGLGLAAQAAICFETAVQIDPDARTQTYPWALSLLVLQLADNADWAGLQPHLQRWQAMVDTGSAAQVSNLAPFTLLALPTTPDQQLRVARLRSRELSGHLKPLPPPGPRLPGRLRIGWLSCDFHRHATVLLVAELLERLDRKRFEVVLYCHSREDGTPEQSRVRATADRFRDVRRLSDAEVAQVMRDDGIDIAIDLKGHTQHSRMQILACRPAPVQAGFLGYPATSGADFIDYMIGDPVVTPLEHGAQYSEHIAQMPHSYQPNDGRRALPPAPARAELGLPEGAVLLCCFNQSYKITESQVELWARILREAPDASLWLLNWNDAASARLSAAFEARGVDPSRLYFSERVGVEENLARLQCADLFLDTWPCNAHTTASEALWAGVPVLTVPGDTFASRVASSLVSACELDEFICPDAEAYVTRAVALAREPEPLRAAQRHLRARRATLPLFDAAAYARDFGALLERMWARHVAGIGPAPLPAHAGGQA